MGGGQHLLHTEGGTDPPATTRETARAEDAEPHQDPAPGAHARSAGPTRPRAPLGPGALFGEYITL